jgi:hypothetical protein
MDGILTRNPGSMNNGEVELKDETTTKIDYTNVGEVDFSITDRKE